MKKNASILMILTGIISIFGFAKSMTLAYFYGASPIADAYIIGTTVPALLFAFFGHAVKSGFIPIFGGINEEKGQKPAIDFTNNIISLLTVALLIAYLFILVFASPIVGVLAPGLDEDIRKIAIDFTRIISLSMLLLGLTSVFTAYLNYKNNYSIPAISIIPMDIIILISIYLSAKYNVMFLAYGYLLGSLSQTLTLIPYLLKSGYSYMVRFELKEENTKAFFILILPIIFSVAVNDINKIVDKSLASLVAVGGVSALSYSGKLTGFIQSTVIISISTVLFPALSKFASSNNLISLKKSMKESIKLITLLIVPAIFGIIFFAEDIITLLFGRGEFDQHSIKLTSDALVFYSIGMIGFGMNSIFSRYFFAMKNSKVPMLSAIYNSIINVTLNFAFYYFTDLGVAGLALSTSIASILSSIWLSINVRRIIGSILDSRELLYIFKILFSSGVMIATSKTLSNLISIYTEIGSNFTIIISIIFAIIIYSLCLIILKVKKTTQLFNSLVKKIRRK